MLIETKKITIEYTRTSILKKSHTYSRTKTIAVFQCDRCKSLFEREQGKMDYRRISNNYYHVCPDCNPKQFAQSKSAEQRQLWNLSVDSDHKI